jgi:NAD(P)-dependent dehydrogenase (short-subunit alcohol dehydrogenase family)
MRLVGRVVAITGGGSGLGADACRLSRARGARPIAVVDRDSAAAERVAAEVGGKPVTADVASEEQVRAAVAAVEAEFGQVDVWVHNAGIGAKTSTFTPDETWQRMWQVHVMAIVYDYARSAVRTAVASEEAARMLLDLIENGQFLTTTYPPVIEEYRLRSQDPDAYLALMRGVHDDLVPGVGAVP